MKAIYFYSHTKACSGHMTVNIHIYSGLSLLFCMSLYLNVAKPGTPTVITFKKHSQSSRETCLSLLPFTYFLRPKKGVCTHQNLPWIEHTEVDHSLIRGLLHETIALTKSVRTRNKSNFHNDCLKQNLFLCFQFLFLRRKFQHKQKNISNV